MAVKSPQNKVKKKKNRFLGGREGTIYDTPLRLCKQDIKRIYVTEIRKMIVLEIIFSISRSKFCPTYSGDVGTKTETKLFFKDGNFRRRQ